MFQTTNQNVYVCSIHIMHLHFLLLFVLLANLLQGLWRRPFPRRSRGYHKQAERTQGISRLSPRLQPAWRTSLTLTPFEIRMALGAVECIFALGSRRHSVPWNHPGWLLPLTAWRPVPRKRMEPIREGNFMGSLQSLSSRICQHDWVPVHRTPKQTLLGVVLQAGIGPSKQIHASNISAGYH